MPETAVGGFQWVFAARKRYGLSEVTKEGLGFKGKGHEVTGGEGNYQLKESPAPYKGILVCGNEPLRLENEYRWKDYVVK